MEECLHLELGQAIVWQKWAINKLQRLFYFVFVFWISVCRYCFSSEVDGRKVVKVTINSDWPKITFIAEEVHTAITNNSLFVCLPSDNIDLLLSNHNWWRVRTANCFLLPAYFVIAIDHIDVAVWLDVDNIGRSVDFALGTGWRCFYDTTTAQITAHIFLEILK